MGRSFMDVFDRESIVGLNKNSKNNTKRKSNGSGHAADLAADFSEIQWYAKRAKAAYLAPEAIHRQFSNVVRIKTLDHIDVQYFVELHPQEKVLLISVRGTANLTNAKDDAEYLQSKNSKLDIYVHKGFDEDTAEIYADLKPYLLADHTIKVTGHSLGAAISTLLMMYLHEDGYKVGKSINFGQPKLTNRRGVERYESLPLTRIVDEEDVVPLVPPITLLNSIHGVYQHLGDEIILLADQYYVYLQEHEAERKSVGSFWKNIGHQSVEEHFMDNYLKNIEPKLEAAVAVDYAEREAYLHG